jgi:hypothetical protein
MCEQFYKPTLQTKFDKQGNCLSAVIATLFPIGLDDVPLFCDNDETWAFELNKWMAEKFGKYVVPVNLAEPEHYEVFCKSMVITAINSPNPKVDRHAVITENGRIIFDPMVGEVDRKLKPEMEPTFFILGNIIHR